MTRELKQEQVYLFWVLKQRVLLDLELDLPILCPGRRDSYCPAHDGVQLLAIS